MRCYHCSHEIKDSAFAYKGRQECKECHSIYQIHFPSGVGFIPIVIAFIPALYMVTILRYAFIVGLAIFVIFYWAIDIIMNNILIYLGKFVFKKIKSIIKYVNRNRGACMQAERKSSNFDPLT